MAVKMEDWMPEPDDDEGERLGTPPPADADVDAEKLDNKQQEPDGEEKAEAMEELE